MKNQSLKIKIQSAVAKLGLAECSKRWDISERAIRSWLDEHEEHGRSPSVRAAMRVLKSIERMKK